MNNMKIPTRPAPSVEEARQITKRRKPINDKIIKKAPPPRPPPPNFEKAKSKSAWNLNQPSDNFSLIDWSPPSSPKSAKNTFGGSISSSFSSSTSSLGSSKKSFEYESVNTNNSNPWNQTVPFPFPTYGLQAKTDVRQVTKATNNKVGPTIIRPQPPKKPLKSENLLSIKNVFLPPPGPNSPPMPTIPPPKPPEFAVDAVEPFGVALYNYQTSHKEDLTFQENDIVYLVKKINNEWYYGRVDDREGIFPANFIEVQVPLKADPNMVTALFEFRPEMSNDLALKPGQSVRILKKISKDWLWGECNGNTGQFPSNFVDKIPSEFL